MFVYSPDVPVSHTTKALTAVAVQSNTRQGVSVCPVLSVSRAAVLKTQTVSKSVVKVSKILWLY